MIRLPVLDTSFVVDVIRGHEKAGRLFRILEQESAVLGVSAATAYELFTGVARSETPGSEERKVEQFIESLALLPFELPTARIAGLLASQLTKRGSALGVVDLFIAATALEHGEPLVTRDRKDYERVPGLKLLSY